MNRNRQEHMDLTKKPLSFTEAAMLADNLESIEHFRRLQRSSNAKARCDSSAPSSLVGKLVGAIIIAALAYGFLGIAYAVICVLFMFF